MCDSKGLITSSRDSLTPEKEIFAKDHDPADLTTVIAGADVFVGLSKGIVSKDMVKTIAANPIVFALRILIQRSVIKMPWLLVKTSLWPRDAVIIPTR